ncbi:aldehyde ferredoxin oxidoreductase [Thermanaerosceptrum fracticalcis]|uniref:Aldehyde ferredoxin oxidoreductase n=1 Tax=Thermanaerosceptrum fracticalcis TaxID=1712410 RepID=A0A7G6E534_THEFR|nr:aldehyde ferredoxin oxidoreductase family protein [Thermanaerosceptrum fracticalcis]QNB47188.1 aldehyde ferredoxin oxidoreductase [Thermanaerosceptrum fracticalcis]
MYSGYNYKVLKINLSNETTEIENITPTFVRKFLGGNGFGVKLLYDAIKPETDPLSEENSVVIAVGPANGTIMPGAAMTAFMTKSPLTGLFIDSYMGGHFATEIKNAGYDAILISGKLSKPKFLVIENDTVNFCDAQDLWGLETSKTQQKIKERLQNTEFQVACIGPAGENLVKYASIISDTRAAGRGGLGAVFGSKKLKAIAIRGDRDIYVAQPARVLEYVQKAFEEMKKHPGLGKNVPLFGSTGSIDGNNSLGILGTRNWQREVFDDAWMISGNNLLKRGLRVGHKSCASCMARSAIFFKANEGEYSGTISRGPEYETLYSYGSVLENNNPDSIIAADRLSDELGIDTMSTGLVIAWVMECFEKGILTSRDTDGLEVTFGKHEILLDMIKKIAYRDGIGDVLAEGTRIASRIIGKGSEDFAIHVKGLELAGHTARGLKGMGLGYAVATRGGSHQDIRPEVERSGKLDRQVIEGKSEHVMKSERMCTIGDSLILCRRHSEPYFGPYLSEKYVEVINILTGFDLDLEELNMIADRIYTLERMFNCREGITRKDDILPPRFMREPIPDGPSKGMYMKMEELNVMLDEFYSLRGWDLKTGIPTEAKMRTLGIN